MPQGRNESEIEKQIVFLYFKRKLGKIFSCYFQERAKSLACAGRRPQFAISKPIQIFLSSSDNASRRYEMLVATQRIGGPLLLVSGRTEYRNKGLIFLGFTTFRHKLVK